MKTTLHFGKIDYLGTGRKNCPVEVTVELRNQGGDPVYTYKNGRREFTGNYTPEYVELSICGNIWNHLHTNIYAGGQCLDTIAQYVKTPEFLEIYAYWKKYHLNGLNAGTPEQEAAVKAWRAAGMSCDYDDLCNMLKDIDLYEVNYTGLTIGRRYENEPYKYGHAWIVNPLPGDVLIRIEHIITANNGR